MGRMSHLQAAAGAMALAAVCAMLLASTARSPQVLLQTASTEQLWGGWLANLDNAVPNNGQAVDIGGRLIRPIGAKATSLHTMAFMPDQVKPETKYEGGMFYGHHIRNARPVQAHSNSPHVSAGILNALRSDAAQQGPPAWWQRKHQAWLAKQIQQQLHPTAPPHPRPALHPPAPPPHMAAPRPAAPPPRAVSHRPAPLLPSVETIHAAEAAIHQAKVRGPSEGQVEDAYKKALALQGKVKEAKQKSAAAGGAPKQGAKQVGKKGGKKGGREGEEQEAEALEHTAASLKQLAKAMGARDFVASPERLANIAGNLALVSDSLSEDAKKEAKHLH